MWGVIERLYCVDHHDASLWLCLRMGAYAMSRKLGAFYTRRWAKTVASPKKLKNPTMSVTVVKMIEEDCAGS